MSGKEVLSIYFQSWIGSVAIVSTSIFAFYFLAIKLGNYNEKDKKPGQVKRELGHFFLTFGIMNTGLPLLSYLTSLLGFSISYNFSRASIFVSFLIMFFSVDFLYYWFHRALHTKYLFRFHKIHHDSKVVGPTTSFAFNYTEVIGNLILPFIVLFLLKNLVVINYWGILIYDLVYFVGTVWLHSNLLLSAYFTGWLHFLNIIAPSTHSEHHTQYRGNYGLYLLFFDRAFNTELKIRSGDEQNINEPSTHFDSNSTK